MGVVLGTVFCLVAHHHLCNLHSIITVCGSDRHHNMSRQVKSTSKLNHASMPSEKLIAPSFTVGTEESIPCEVVQQCADVDLAILQQASRGRLCSRQCT